MRSATPKTPTDSRIASLLQESGQKNRAAFAELYNATSAKLFGMLIRILQNREEASDILQEVYLTIWRRSADYDPGKGEALAWMAVIARNAAIDCLRKRRPVVADEDRIADLPSGERSPFQSVGEMHARMALDQRLGILSDNQRRAVILFYLEERSIRDTAGAMGASVNTTKSWIRRGLQKLKTEFSDLSVTDLVA